MAKEISYNSYDLQDSNFRVKDIIYRNMPEKVIDVMQKARRDGFNFVNAYFTQKNIQVSGTVTSDTEANLKTKVDEMKAAFQTDEAALVIDDNGTNIAWTCSVERLDIPEQHYHITRLPFDISFKCQPFGKATSATTDTNAITQASSAPFTDTIDPTGSMTPLPALKWLCNGSPSAAITSIEFENTTTGDIVTVSGLAMDNNGDYLEIDTDAMTIKVSHDGGAATAIDFTGVFPRFSVASNSYSVTILGGGATWALTQTIVYYPLYL
jgi:hypothetical protein